MSNLILLFLILALSMFSPQEEKDCTYKKMKLYGKVKFVQDFPDLKIKIVEDFPDLKVQIVENFPDLKVKIVKDFPDIKVKFVESFPGLP